ncbi:carboxyl-terminal processing protease [Mucilaginibacter mallensis]|uniref:Carboxyl-terminal processing protease n=1 Tax=Mucilaginibacter mallensis TaxID=652787 RepID=A0A1H2C5Y0_MUCMA|nr:S41 family peptidase [Mucilaginibacter mallensis]SDT65719.1 carboxyl-terminal processing protease [Mucilaginibacter mallensis]
MKSLATLIALIIFPVLSYCQTIDKTANDAFVLIRMVNKFHVEPREVNSAFSVGVFKGMLQATDPGRIYFTSGDIYKLSPYTTTLNYEIKHRRTAYLSLFISIYQQRLKQADSLISIIGKTPFNFYTAEKLTVPEDTLHPQSLAAMQLKLYKKIKSGVLDELIDDMPDNFKALSLVKQKKYVDSAEVVFRKKVVASYKRRINHVLQNPYGITQYVGDIYCSTIATCFDPHTQFFPPEEKEMFEGELGKQRFMFGFTIKPDKAGGVLIDKLEPGSPAFKGGKLNKGDKFMALQWEGSPPVDVSDASINELSALMAESNHKAALFTMKKADGSTIQVSLQKEQVATDDDEGKVKSFILKGSGNTVGYIYLPAFYQDWDTNNDGLNGCANDVGREIIKLKKENINGLILDLRYNGGGSAGEATELSGIFIDAGPVEQVKEKNAKIYTMKDVDRGTIYDGPLVILVNGYSASASELVAGTLQDYNRAVIIGSPTYGKATAQVVFPMDTTVTYESMQVPSTNYLKITISRLYRVNGTTAQFKGVQPDIVLPDILDAYITKEADEPFALRPGTIAANKYYQPYPPQPLKALAAGVQTEIDTNKYFNAVKNFIAYSKQHNAVKDVSLNLKDALADTAPGIKMEEDAVAPGSRSKKFSVKNNQYELARMQADGSLKELNEEFSKQLSSDAYVGIAYDVLAKLKTP